MLKKCFILNGVFLLISLTLSKSSSNLVTSREFSKPNQVVQKGNLVCLGDMMSKSLFITQNDFYTSEAEFANLSAGDIVSKRINTKDLLTSVIMSPSNSLTISALLKVTGQIRYESSDNQKTSFIQLSHDSLFLENVKQWKLINDFSMKEINLKLNEHLALKYLNNLDLKDNSPFEFTQNINISSKWIDHILIESNFRFLNSLWNNNTAYIKIGADLYWLEHHNWDETSCDEERWTSHIKIIIPFKKQSENIKDLSLTFGIKLDDQVIKCPEIIKDYRIQQLIELISFDDLQISVK
jgi:hypothetical protein